MAAAYDASSIRILAPEERDERWMWTRVAVLAVRYPHVPEAFLLRLLEACELSGCPEHLAVRRYCDGDASVVLPPELGECHRELARAAQSR